MLTIAQLKDMALADRYTRVLRDIRAADADEARDERIAIECEWSEYAEQLTAAYHAARDAAVMARNPGLVDAMIGLESEGGREAVGGGLVKNIQWSYA